LRSLEHVLLAPNASTPPTFTPQNPALHAFVREAGGKRYLLVASDSRRAEEATLKLDGAADGEARPLSGGEGGPALHISKGAAILKLPPLGVAMFDISGP
ncbi:MAG: hypothetical protein NT049_02300, partial [Planctomycetota bacterium]|nr:hypothetical protein [Planctomycetota bacterium]